MSELRIHKFLAMKKEQNRLRKFPLASTYIKASLVSPTIVGIWPNECNALVCSALRAKVPVMNMLVLVKLKQIYVTTI